jgi:hypothetical protein
MPPTAPQLSETVTAMLLGQPAILSPEANVVCIPWLLSFASEKATE